MSERILRVGLDARLADGTHGGVQQVLLGLAGGLASLPPGPEEYLFLVREGEWDWLRPHLRGPCRPLEVRSRPAWRRRLDGLATRFRGTSSRLLGRREEPGAVDSDGTVERAGIDVMHLTLQDGFRTRIPTIYTPYDLQHVHHPSFFTPEELRARELVYPDLCRRAEAVVAISRWGKRDLVETFGLPPGKVRVIHLASATDAYGDPPEEEVAKVRGRLSLPDAFALYTAQTWPHKNHAVLLEALALLRRDAGLVVPLVLTGGRTRHFPTVKSRIDALGLGDQVTALGHLTPVELSAVYRSARVMVFPSLFEGFGMPILEAFRAGLPVACSSATSLPEVAGDAAILFDPHSVAGVADAVRRLWVDENLRSSLVARGRERVTHFDWGKTAIRHRALYRQVAGRPLEALDERLLAEMAVQDGG